MAPRPGRDLALRRRGRGWLLLACDSAGGVGPKPADSVAAAAEVVGAFTARVALAEVLAVGATPLLVSVTCAVEPEPTGAGLLAGVRSELAGIGCAGVPLVVSTEKNLPTVQTGVGVSVTAWLAGPWPRGRAGDGLYLVGVPKVGAAVRLDDPEIADLQVVVALRSLAHAVVPVGSRGPWHEAGVIAAEAGLTAEAVGEPPHGSAGPATAVVVAAAAPPPVSLPVRLMGWLR